MIRCEAHATGGEEGDEGGRDCPGAVREGDGVDQEAKGGRGDDEVLGFRSLSDDCREQGFDRRIK